MRVGSILTVVGVYVSTVGLTMIFAYGKIRVGVAFVFVGANMIYFGVFTTRRRRRSSRAQKE